MARNDELFHSGFYRGVEFDDGLQHWKYLRKYKSSSGKWVYVYADKDTHDKLQKQSDAAAAGADREARIKSEMDYAMKRGDKGRYRKLKMQLNSISKGNKKANSVLDSKLGRNSVGSVIKRSFDNIKIKVAKFLGLNKKKGATNNQSQQQSMNEQKNRHGEGLVSNTTKTYSKAAEQSRKRNKNKSSLTK